jgi:SRSO17 transposase
MLDTEVRSQRGWYRHVTLSILVHAYLVVTKVPRG